MDMDLWWCPVCERAITEQEEPAQRPSLLKRATVPPSQPRYTSRGGVYGPKGSLYCSEACREVEELNGRFAFEQLAACLPDLVGRSSSRSEAPESEGTLSGTDEINTDRSRSTSSGRQSESTAPGPRTSTSPEQLSRLTPNSKSQALTTTNGGSAKETIDSGLPNRRVPILLSSNGTPLIQPTFPQRPAIGQNQRRHHSHYSPQKRCSPHSTAVTRTGSGLKVSTIGVLPSSSVPNYPPSATGANVTKISTTSILNHRPTVCNDMEFSVEARSEKPASLLRHYSLFFRSRPGSLRGEWTDSADEPQSAHQLDRIAHRHTSARSSRQQSQTGSQQSRRSSVQLLTRSLAGKTDPADETVESSASLSKRLLHRKDRKSHFPDNTCRFWTWDHLPADVPQYPAMDLAQIRLSKLLRQQADASILQPSTNKQILTLSDQIHFRNLQKIDKSASFPNLATDSIDAFPITQSKKKLFIFH
ncbi:hypothetical protein Pst134EA_021357 [Puccinia striiformis f. sp. tritici]|uniref:Uncharacterized protein n=1 Tax=Puccinia striiformis f. sp. tritici PST-78 TaxID=1165861 RepID=A0A0L0W0V2_9BASI|nr:hypothetical protein Pst134EA_021357 [Puccinia striiformis f. sp. tritici]KAH9457482.1 hypothetical protein Pst134EA_021357 [Puccinia striiformis f. sp. tritici]KAI9627649.1 hypothetical protein KEM48_012112 [Puccinia striiformis f. sp. tritici PST-130]KNF04910.1 hypothetical protein PSTG_01968 [Puccinia striiformis f. sp. tritici PST-78]